jgi:hypothetical protein
MLENRMSQLNEDEVDRDEDFSLCWAEGTRIF